MREIVQLKKGPVVLYEQMRLRILELILEQGLQPHDPVPSEAELAKLFGVSTRTSKEALLQLAKEGVVYRLPRRGTFLAKAEVKLSEDHSDNVSGETKNSGSPIRNNRQFEASVKDHPSRSVPRTVVIVVPALDEYAGKVCEAASRALQSEGYEAVLRFSDGELDAEEAIIRDLKASPGIEGIILFPGNRRTCGDEVLRLHLEKYPIVLVDRMFREIRMSSVYHDHFQGAYQLTQYLADMGHRLIGFVSEDISGIMSREDRYYGYTQAHADRGMAVQSEAVLLKWGDRHQETEAAEDVLQRYLNNNPGMTAVFCSNDYVALQLMNAAGRIGRRVPEDLSVAGFTDLAFARVLAVPLTSVRKPTGPLGEGAAKLLLERIRHPEAEALTVKLPTELVLRESVSRIGME
ncbi:hypothetical protein SY83_20290 [Paenibacillus swuensis]|uniref:HTH gntR-type domain-containing protein n=1 Tax=Paenibacillus swuensis TaxID=1178515 RepID=A0A172TNB4_9BACL|nr:GntR family transcriptional regulator [Paenibacillus swuensis]ANE48243.1 hypothetical protein SY83_20290 [Paenibacillus swuensis]